jgi:hypothetical protein
MDAGAGPEAPLKPALDFPDPLLMGGQGERILAALRALSGALRELAALACAASCASLSSDVHLSPLVSHLSLAGGADEVEGLAGAVRVVRDAPGAPVREWELHPIVCHDDLGDSELTRFLVPFGRSESDETHSTTFLIPLFQFQREPDANGEPGWRLLALPAIIWGEDSTPRTLRGVFPFGGVWENFATYDRITFVLFPLFVRTERDGGRFTHFLWPIFSWGHNRRGELDGHFWPFYGVARPGESESRFVLWPFFLWSRQRLSLPEEHQVKTWMSWPFFGKREAGTFRAWTVLWPFFGYSRDPASGFWSFDGPWPLVRIQRPGTSGQAYRTRAWPFYSYYEGDGLRTRWVLWPIFNRRDESYEDGSRQGESVLPFWQHFVERDLDGAIREDWQQLWPLFLYHRVGPSERVSFPTLLPLPRSPNIQEHYAWLWELYARQVETTPAGAVVHERSWGGLWRRETEPGDEREYLAGLWSRRKYREGGHTRRETSLLFGLLRWRTSRDGGFEPLKPALPGPGWPARPQVQIEAESGAGQGVRC